MHLDLYRQPPTRDGILGVLAIGELQLCTAEDDLGEEDAAGKGAIPVGSYLLKRTVYHKHDYETFEVTGVPGRSRILIHPGNTEEDTLGCILVGMRHGPVQVASDEDAPGHGLRLKQGVLESKKAFGLFMLAMDGIDEATLTIEWA